MRLACVPAASGTRELRTGDPLFSTQKLTAAASVRSIQNAMGGHPHDSRLNNAAQQLCARFDYIWAAATRTGNTSARGEPSSAGGASRSDEVGSQGERSSGAGGSESGSRENSLSDAELAEVRKELAKVQPGDIVCAHCKEDWAMAIRVVGRCRNKQCKNCKGDGRQPCLRTKYFATNKSLSDARLTAVDFLGELVDDASAPEHLRRGAAGDAFALCQEGILTLPPGYVGLWPDGSRITRCVATVTGRSQGDGWKSPIRSLVLDVGINTQTTSAEVEEDLRKASQDGRWEPITLPTGPLRRSAPASSGVTERGVGVWAGSGGSASAMGSSSNNTSSNSGSGSGSDSGSSKAEEEQEEKANGAGSALQPSIVQGDAGGDQNAAMSDDLAPLPPSPEPQQQWTRVKEAVDQLQAGRGWSLQQVAASAEVEPDRVLSWQSGRNPDPCVTKRLRELIFRLHKQQDQPDTKPDVQSATPPTVERPERAGGDGAASPRSLGNELEVIDLTGESQ